jgi:hypothetical protein
MKSSQAKKAVEKIAELTGAEISEDNLFLESIVMSNARLRLAISKVGDCVEMNRIPASYFWGHFTMLCSVIGICIFGFLEAQQSSTVENVKAIIWSVIIITSGYGFIAWVNRKAERENPVLSYDLKKKLLVAGPQRRRIKRDAILCIIALASVPRRANKPQTRSELKLIYRSDTGTGFDFAVIARNSKPHLPDYDDEITPFARGLKIPYLHVSRSIVGKDFDVNRIV